MHSGVIFSSCWEDSSNLRFDQRLKKLVAICSARSFAFLTSSSRRMCPFVNNPMTKARTTWLCPGTATSCRWIVSFCARRAPFGLVFVCPQLSRTDGLRGCACDVVGADSDRSGLDAPQCCARHSALAACALPPLY